MACPRNALGQPACFITAHPSRPDHKFCVTCYQQFPQPTESQSTKPKSSLNLFHWAIAILILLVVVKAMEIQPTPVSQPVHRFETLKSL